MTRVCLSGFLTTRAIPHWSHREAKVQNSFPSKCLCNMDPTSFGGNGLIKVPVALHSIITSCVLCCFTNSCGSFCKDKRILFIARSWFSSVVNSWLWLRREVICRLSPCLISRSSFHPLFLNYVTAREYFHQKGKGKEVNWNVILLPCFKKSWSHDVNTAELVNFCCFVWFFEDWISFLPVVFVPVYNCWLQRWVEALPW